MWPIDDIEIRNVQLDFTSSSGGRPRTQAIFAADTCLVNALAYANLNEDPTQLIVCESCGHVRCSSGGWVHIRRIVDSIAFIPAFALMLDGHLESTDYSPPSYLSSRGAPFFAAEKYLEMCALAPGFPSIENIVPITASEAVRLIQWHAPLRVLGSFPHAPQLVRDVILAVSEGQLGDECDCVQRLFDTNVDSSATLSVAVSSDAAPIEFHLDSPGFPAWRPVARIGEQFAFCLEPLSPLLVAAQNVA